MAGYGTVLTTSQAKKTLMEQNKTYDRTLTWNKLLSQNENSALAAENQLIKDYNTATADAYVSYLKNQNAIRSSNIVGAGKTQLLQENELALQDAYNSYMNSLNEGTAAIAESYNEGVNNINSALETEAENVVAYDNAHMSYLQELWNRYTEGENKLFDDPRWQRYTTQDQLRDDVTGELLYNEDGTPMLDERRLMTRDELFKYSYDNIYDEEGNVIGQDNTGFIDENGNLTLKGIDFYDQIENALAGEGGYSWGQYLSESDPDLYEWASSYNPYNYTEAGTNEGTFKTMTGRMSTDYLYSYAERFGGMSEGEIQNLYSQFESKAKDIYNAMSQGDAFDSKDNTKNLKALADEVATLVDDLGLTADFEAETGMTVDSYLNELTRNINSMMSEGEMNKRVLTGAAEGFKFAAGPSGMAALFANTLVPGSGLAVLLAGGVLGGLLGAIDASLQNKKQEDINLLLQEQSKQTFDNMLSGLLQYSLSKRREAEIEFNRNSNLF